MSLDKLNLSLNNNLFALPPVKKINVAGGQPSTTVGGEDPVTNNPSKNNQIGYNLVNSDLKNMSYRLPNGKMSECNTRWVC